MIRARLINSDATINNFNEIGSLEFTPGSEFVIKLQLYNSQLNNRHLPLNSQRVKVSLNPLVAVTVANNPFSIGTTPITANDPIEPSGRNLSPTEGRTEVVNIDITAPNRSTLIGTTITIPRISGDAIVLEFVDMLMVMLILII